MSLRHLLLFIAGMVMMLLAFVLGFSAGTRSSTAPETNTVEVRYL